MSGRAFLGAVLVLCTTVGACSEMLGIEEAHVDAALEGSREPAGSGGSAAAHAGSATSHGGKPGPVTGSSTMEAGRGSDAEAGSALGGAPSVPEPSLCDRYCTLVIASCSGQLEQYRSMNQCLQVCQRLPVGDPGDEDTNTVECRLRQAMFAESEPLGYCKSAGPLGQDKCGSNCVSYCSLMQASCSPTSTAGNLEPSYFLDEQACLTQCGDLELEPGPEDPTAYSSSASAVPSSYVGNNVFCRTYHVAAGLEQAAEDEHCPHAMGGEPCTAQ